ncbi:hypothetical protein [Bradyrhizobium sp. USDA 4529]
MSSGGGGGGDDDSPRPAPKPVKPKKGATDTGGAGDPCNIVERTKVNSPDRTVAATLRRDDVLAVEYDPGPPKRLIVRAASGAVLGSITSPAMPQLIQCIMGGYGYEAIVLTVAGGMIEVQVQPA